MLTPLYVSENAPRAIRGGLTGLYQLFIACGTMLSFWVNYGTLKSMTGNATWQVPLALQCLPALYVFFLLCVYEVADLVKLFVHGDMFM